jgi:TetR/AcrR family transcriptional regulator
MVQEATETENLIKETAKRVFFSNGHINASTKEIAKEAGVNRALIHYYFRSRDFLFNMVLEEAMRSVSGKITAILGSDLDLRSKVRAFLDTFIREMAEFPYLETFMVIEIAKNPEKMSELHPKNADQVKAIVDEQIQGEIAAGTLSAITIDHFMVNLMSLCNYPLIAKPVIQTIFGYDDNAYKKFLAERKKVVYKAIFNEEYPEI